MKNTTDIMKDWNKIRNIFKIDFPFIEYADFHYEKDIKLRGKADKLKVGVKTTVEDI